MARGMKDWGMYSPVEAIQKGLDIGELATRIGSVVGFDRAGTAIFVDDCSSGLTKWRIVEWTGEKVRPQYGYNIFGGYSIQLTDDGADTHRPEIYTGLPLFEDVQAGIELVANFVYGRTVIILDLEFDDGVNSYRYKVMLSNYAGTLQILDKVSGWITIGSFTTIASGAMWTFILKMVIDHKQKKYKKIRLNNQVIDVSGYEAYVGSSSTPGNIEVDITAGYETDTYSGGININAVIVTINE